jgi:hypothetical protein
MKSSETNEVTKATAIAINNAAENINKVNSTNLQTNLRLPNLERNLRRHEQKSNKFIKKIKSDNNKTQKTHQEAILQSQWPLHNNRLFAATKQNKNKKWWTSPWKRTQRMTQ